VTSRCGRRQPRVVSPPPWTSRRGRRCGR
jgi:hypothetical protein